MVIRAAFENWGDTLPVLFAERGRAAIERLDPATRARVLAALAGLVILGFGMMAIAWLGARMTRHYMRRFDIDRRRSATSRVHDDDWAQRPLAASETDEDDSES